MDQPIGLSLREGLGILTLILSLVGNGFQLYRQWHYGNTIYNGLVGTFNNIGWLLARCMNRTGELNQRISGHAGGQEALLGEFRDFSMETEFHLRALHEQLVAIARTLRRRDRRWQAGEFGYTPEEVERIRRAFSQEATGGS